MVKYNMCEIVRGVHVKNIGFIFIGTFLLLVGCNSNSSNEPVKEEKKTEQFSLVIEGDKKLYQEDENIQISP